MKKTLLYLSCIIIGLLSTRSVFAVDTATTTWDSIGIYIGNIDKKVEKMTTPDKKEYYKVIITKLEDRINQYKKIQDMLQWRIKSIDSFPIWTITGSVIDTTNWATSLQFQAKECTISLWATACFSPLFVSAPSGKHFTVRNITRNIVSNDLINPSNYKTVLGWTNPIYSVTNSSFDNPANLLQFGENKLDLMDGDRVVTSTISVATCASGGTWNGKNCVSTTTSELNPTDPQVWSVWASGIIPPVKITWSDCSIPKGESTCLTYIYVYGPPWKDYTVVNLTRNITTQIIPDQNSTSLVIQKYILNSSSDGDVANKLKYGENNIIIRDAAWNGIVKGLYRWSCETGLVWNGKVCEWVQFKLLSYITKQGEKTYTDWAVIQYNPSLDWYLTLRGTGPIGNVQIQNSKSITSTYGGVMRATNTAWTWQLWNINTDEFITNGTNSYTIWDGKDISSKIEIQIQGITNQVIQPPVTWGGRSGWFQKNLE